MVDQMLTWEGNFFMRLSTAPPPPDLFYSQNQSTCLRISEAARAQAILEAKVPLPVVCSLISLFACALRLECDCRRDAAFHGQSQLFFRYLFKKYFKRVPVDLVAVYFGSVRSPGLCGG